jgi:DNA repair photolyase
MTTWDKQKLPRENGEIVDMLTPVIVSASRSTDIPAFYSDWFFHRLDVGYSAWTNPFNGVRSYVSYKNTRFIVFWSKNPRPLINHIDELKHRNIGCYIQYSVNDYEAEGLEKNLPPLSKRIDTFKQLVNRLGLGRVIWRFDPLILTDRISIDLLLNKIENIGDQLFGYTKKLVFSFADIEIYGKVRANLNKANIKYIDWQEEQMHEFAERLVQLNEKWHFNLATCGEKIQLDNISHNHCVDDELIIRFAYHDKELMDYLNVKILPMPEADLFGGVEEIPKDAIILPDGTYAIHGNNRDNGQRKFCGCIKSKDIGEYNTCIHGCEYCYANASRDSALRNFKCYKANPLSETITGK